MWKPWPVHEESKSRKLWVISLVICFICFCLILGGLAAIIYRTSSSKTLFWSPDDQHQDDNPKPNDVDHSYCFGKYIYMYDVSSAFNVDVINNCSSLSEWFDMCSALMNGGFGPRVEIFDASQSWYATIPFTLEVIFHNRMKGYRCLTSDSSLASAFYVPFYAGLDAARNSSLADENGIRLANWMRKRAEWQSRKGRDHFFVAVSVPVMDIGSTAWGRNLFFLPEFKHMNVFTTETFPWISTGIVIPYPAFYHPSSEQEVVHWQEMVQTKDRPYLYSFVDAPRPNTGDSIDGSIIRQCLASGNKCKLLQCSNGLNCYDPVDVMMVTTSSTFCLQPTGHSPTRRSILASILGGCIPVFFNPTSAYTQDTTYFPSNQSSYSVLIPESEVRERKADIEKILLGIPEIEVEKMQDKVINLIMNVIYLDPMSGFLNISEDAFDLAIKKVLDRINATL